MKKLLSVLLAVLMLLSASALAEFDKSIPDGTTFTFWYSFTGANEEKLKEQIAAFEAENPGIKVDAQYIGGYNAIREAGLRLPEESRTRHRR